MEKNKEIKKMTKKERKEFYSKQRTTWSMSPVTRKPEKPGAYNRNKEKQNLRKAGY